MKKLKLKVTGMHCKSCETLIKDGLSEIEGVEKIDVFSSKGTAMVDYDETKTSEYAIKSAIRKEGYGVDTA